MNILVVGAGGMGRRHVQALAETKRCTISCVDPNNENLEKARSIASLYYEFTNISQIKEKFDGVIISTPTDTHLSFAQWCVGQGLPFLLEKPISVDENGLDGLIRSVEEKKIVAGVAYPRRYSLAVRELKNLLSLGTIGDLKMINSIFSQDFRKYRPDYQRIYYAHLSSGGGILMDALSHHVDLVTYFSGEAMSVHSFYDRLVFEQCEGEDSAIIQIRFRNNILASIQGNQFQKPNIDYIELIGTNGNIRYERLSGKLSINNSDSVVWEDKFLDGNWDKIILSQANHFLDAVEKKGRLNTSLTEGWHTLKIILAARKSQEIHQTIDL